MDGPFARENRERLFFLRFYCNDTVKLAQH